MKGIAVFALLCGLLGPAVLFSQENPESAVPDRDRNTIPEVLMRPQRGEAPRYPTDLVIGILGQGDVPYEAYRFAREVMEAFAGDSRNAPALSTVSSVSREALFSSIKEIEPQKFRLGSGREEPDGAFSFLVRFMGREQGIAGELYIRRGTAELGGGAGETAEAAGEEKASAWQFDELILEEPLNLAEGQEESSFDLPPYERFF